MKINSDSYWQVSLDGVKVGDTEVINQVEDIVFDSGASLMYVPSADYRRLSSAIFSGSNAPSCSLDTASGITFCDCTSITDSRYPEIQLTMGHQYTFFLNGSNYLIYESSRRRCIFTFIEDTTIQKFWLVGDPFLRAYVAVHDMDSQRIGLAGRHIDNGYNPPDDVSSSSEEEDDPFLAYVIWILIGVAATVMIPVSICIVRRCRRKANLQKIHD